MYWVDPPTEAADPVAEYVRVGNIIAEAVTTNGIPRTVFQSSIGAEMRSGAGEIDGLAATEQALDATGANVLHLRCGFFFSNLLLQLDAVRAGTVPIILPVDQPMGWVAPRDIAEVAVSRLLNTDWSGRVVQAVHGPVDLSWSEAMKIVSEVTGHEVTVEQIPDDDMRDMLAGSGMGRVSSKRSWGCPPECARTSLRSNHAHRRRRHRPRWPLGRPMNCGRCCNKARETS